MTWFDSVEHNRWLSTQMQALIREAEGAIVPTGFAHLTLTGEADPTRSIDLAVTSRMLYVFSLGTLMGLPGSRRYADHAMRCLRTYFKDPVNGGMWTSLKAHGDEAGHGVPWDETGRGKSQIHHAFLILGAAAAAVANRPGAHELLGEVLREQESRWLTSSGLVHDQWDEAFTTSTPIHSMGTLFHTAEAYLAAAEATTDPIWIDRVETMTSFVYRLASENAWRIPEYFTNEGTPVATPPEGVIWDGRRAYDGTVPGRGMQWARLSLSLRAALRSMGRTVPDYLFELANEVFERSRVDAWRKNGHAGFVTTLDPDGAPLATERLQWVVCEGICATVAIRRAMLDGGARPDEVEHFDHCYRSWLDYANDYLITQPGRWRRGLSETNEALTVETASRWDVYHALQTMLMPRVPLWPPFASAISRGLLDKPQEAPSDKKSWNFFGIRS